jgi:hypothetical protein
MADCSRVTLLRLLGRLDRVLVAGQPTLTAAANEPVAVTEQEIRLSVSAEDCSRSIFKWYGLSALVPSVCVYDRYAVLTFRESRTAYRCNCAVNRAILNDKTIWWDISGDGDPPASVTLAGYKKRKRQVWKQEGAVGKFVDDPSYDRDCRFSVSFNKV